jgi:hypothetical protein
LTHSKNTITHINDVFELVLPHRMVELLKLFKIVLNYSFLIFFIQ